MALAILEPTLSCGGGVVVGDGNSILVLVKCCGWKSKESAEQGTEGHLDVGWENGPC